MTSLREQWTTLASRQRDAKVAEALGVQPEVSWQIVNSENGGTAFDRPSEAEALAWLREKQTRGLMIGYAVERWEDHRPYSTSWAYAGPLLDQLRSEGRDYILVSTPAGHCVSTEGDTSRQVDSPWCPTGPEAVALAFCLAKEGR